MKRLVLLLLVAPPLLTEAIQATEQDELLSLFLAHQHNAVEMADLETATGENSATTEFATRVRDSRQAGIQQMLSS